MAAKRKRKAKKRPNLSREQVLQAALTLADASGIEGLSMRRLGDELGVEAMSLYNHVRNKDDLLDGMVELVAQEIELPSPDVPWRKAMLARAHSFREVLLRHPWAAAMMESRVQSGPARLRYHNSVLGTLRRAGFSTRAAYHAYLSLDSYIYGFALHEASWSFESEERPEVTEALAPQISPDEYPHLVELMGYVMATAEAKAETGALGAAGYKDDFEMGIKLILDGLEQRFGRCEPAGQPGVNPSVK